VVVERAAGVQLLAPPIGEPPDREQVRTREQTTPVIERQALAGVELVGDIEKV